MPRDLSRLLRPASVAVVGGAWAANVADQLKRAGYAGPIWPVNPNRAEMAGIATLPCLDDLPAAPDATFLGVNRETTPRLVARLAQMGAGGAVCFASGWREAGAGALEADLVEAAGAMPILGPNCYGLVNYLDGVPLWPDQHGGRRISRGVAIISQSSNIAINLTMQARGLPVAYVVCLGNAAQTGLAELGRALVEDCRVTALGLYVEGVGDAGQIAALAEGARAAGKGIVALKGGRSVVGRAAAASHTAALAGDGAVSSAFLRQAGIAEVTTPEALLEALKVLHVHGPRRMRRFCALACSGGEAGLAGDLAEAAGLSLPPPQHALRAALADLLGPRVAIANPLDYQTYIWGDEPRTEAVFATMLADHDAGLFIIDPPRPDRCDPASYLPALRAVGGAQRRSGKPAFVVASLPENLHEDLADRLIAEGIAPLHGLSTALAALASLGAVAGRPEEGSAASGAVEGAWCPWTARPQPAARRMIDEADAKGRLADCGIMVPRGIAHDTLKALRDDPALERLRPPLAFKGLGFAHKTEAGAVRLGLASLAGAAEIPGAHGYLVEEMVDAGIAEMLVGLRRDPVYGAALTIGFGGTGAELVADTVTLVAPADAGVINEALRRLRQWRLLDGYRGRPRADVGAVVAAALALQRAMAEDPALDEVEINPLIVRAQGAVAADAVIWEVEDDDRTG